MSHIYTNDWNILAGKKIRRWPGDEKRPLNVHIYTWIGTSALGAKHYNVKVAEQENEWWCEDKNSWVTIYSDTSARGMSASVEVLSVDDAIKAAMFLVELFAGKQRENHIVYWQGPGKPKWAKQK